MNVRLPMELEYLQRKRSHIDHALFAGFLQESGDAVYLEDKARSVHTYVVGVSADKNVPDIAAELARGADLVVVTRSRHPRAATLDDLADAFSAIRPPFQWSGTLGDPCAHLRCRVSYARPNRPYGRRQR